MRSGCTGGSGGKSRDGVGDTSTAPLAGGGLGSPVVLPRGRTDAAPGSGRSSSSASSPKRGASAAACLGVRGELEELVCLCRALRRGTLGERATDPPAWRALGVGALLLALSESALLGERGGVALGAGLRERWPGWLPAEPGRCGRLASPSGCGLSRHVLASLWRGEAFWRGTVVARGKGCRGGRSDAADAAADAADRGEALSGCKGSRSCAADAAESRVAGAVLAKGGCCRGGRSCAAGAAESRAARTAAALFGGGVAWYGREAGWWLVWSLGCQRGRPLIGVLTRLVWAVLVWGAEYCCQARGDAARRPAWLGVRSPAWCPGTPWWDCRGWEWPLLGAGAPIGAG